MNLKEKKSGKCLIFLYQRYSELYIGFLYFLIPFLSGYQIPVSKYFLEVKNKTIILGKNF